MMKHVKVTLDQGTEPIELNERREGQLLNPPPFANEVPKEIQELVSDLLDLTSLTTTFSV